MSTESLPSQDTHEPHVQGSKSYRGSSRRATADSLHRLAAGSAVADDWPPRSAFAGIDQSGYQHERNNIEDNRYQVQGDTDKFIENTVDNAILYLESRGKADRPFYLNVATQEVHASLWGPGGVYNERLGRGELYGVDPPEKTHVPADFPDNQMSRYMMARFQACIRYMDGQFGRFLDAVDRLGLADDTLMVFTTDHGIAGSRSKGTCYERGLEIATMMRLPGLIPAGMRVGEPLVNLDFLPTFLDAAGAPVPKTAQGKSFWPRLVGGEHQLWAGLPTRPRA